MHRANGNSSQASAALAKTGEWQFTDFDAVQHQAYLDLHDLAASLQTGGRDWSEVTSSELTDLHTLATANVGIASATARQIVNMTQGQTYLKLPPVPVSVAALQLVPPVSETTAPALMQDEWVQAYPNPANNWVIFRLHQIADAGTGRIQVFDNQYRLIFEQTVPAGADKLPWQPQADLPGGIYFYRYICPAQVGSLRKLLLLH